MRLVFVLGLVHLVEGVDFGDERSAVVDGCAVEVGVVSLFRREGVRYYLDYFIFQESLLEFPFSQNCNIAAPWCCLWRST